MQNTIEVVNEVTKESRGRPKSKPGDLVARVRRASGEYQEDFARLIGCGSSTVRYWEINNLLPNSKTQLEALYRLARKHGVSIEDPAR